MKQEMLLPKLRLPGQVNWLVRGLWIFGGVAAVWLAVVLVTLWRRDNRTSAILSASTPAPVAAVPATPVIPAPAAPATAPASTTVPAAPAPVAAQTAARPLKPGVRPGRFGKRGKLGRLGARKGGRYAAKAGARRGSAKSLAARRAWAAKNKRLHMARASAKASRTPTSALAPARRPAARPVAKGGDAIDDILKNFK